MLLIFIFFLLGATSLKSLTLRRFKSDRDKMWLVINSLYVLIDGVRFADMAAMTSFYAEKCCHLMSAHAASARRICITVRQFLIHNTFVLVRSICPTLSGIAHTHLVYVNRAVVWTSMIVATRYPFYSRFIPEIPRRSGFDVDDNARCPRGGMDRSTRAVLMWCSPSLQPHHRQAAKLPSTNCRPLLLT